MAITRTAAPSVATTATPIAKAATRQARMERRAHARVVATASDARALVWGLQALGWAPREAGNIVAIAHGLRPAHDGWTTREIQHLQFLRSIARSGRIPS